MPLLLLGLLQGAPEPAYKATGMQHVTLFDGTRVQIVAVNDNPAMKSWRADGRSYPNWVVPSLLAKMGRTTPFPNTNNDRAFIVEISLPKEMSAPGVALGIPADLGWERAPLLAAESKVRYRAMANKPFKDTSGSISVLVGIAVGPWTVAQKLTNKSPEVKLGVVEFGLTDDQRAGDYRLVAFNAAGKPITSLGEGRPLGAGKRRFDLGSVAKTATSFEFQTRPYTWIEFRSIKLSPIKR